VGGATLVRAWTALNSVHGTLATVSGPLLLLTWIVATVAATGLAWAGVRSVVADVAAPLPAPAVVASAAAPVEPSAPETSRPDPRTPGPARTTTQTFELVGGTATVRFAPETVAVLGAVPAAGFSTDVESNDDHTRVEFDSDGHRSRLEVWWADGPQHQVEEHARGGRGDDDREGSDEGEG